MRRLILLVALAGCARGPSYSEQTVPRQPALYSSAETGTILGERPRVMAATFTVSPATAWIAVKKVYAELEIPITVENPAVHQIGNQNFYKARQFAGRPMSEYVDCGMGMTGPKASHYRIYMSLLTDVFSDGNGGTKVQTTFVPAGQDMQSGNSADRIACATTGRLEGRFLERVKIALGQP